MADGIDQIDEQLKDWVVERVDVSMVSFDRPGGDSSVEGVSLFLLELIDSPPPRTTRPTPLQLSLRYLVTTWADDPMDAHRLLGELVLEAMKTEDFELELETPEESLWQALGTAPQPSFYLRVPFRRERKQPEIQRVRQPLMVQITQVRPLAGRVVGPSERPVAEASVELPALETRTKTDRNGQFKFSAVPRQSEAERLIVRARGMTVETHVELTEPADEDAPVTIRIEPQG
jgi:hypothetical protein